MESAFSSIKDLYVEIRTTDLPFGRKGTSLPCYHCGGPMEDLPSEYLPNEDSYDVMVHPKRCPICGWWILRHWQEGAPGFPMKTYFHALLRDLDVTSANVPMDVLVTYLVRHYDDRKVLTPDRFEELVRSVFREHFDCDVEYYRGNTYTSDGGIDLVMVHSHDGQQVAVQVKRRSANSIESVANIRDFTGALVIEGFCRGVYVTTSSYSRAAKSIPEKLSLMSRSPVAIDLVDGGRFFEMLRATLRFPASEVPWRAALCRLNQRMR